jgi:hypothetical protein
LIQARIRRMNKFYKSLVHHKLRIIVRAFDLKFEI